MVRVGAACESGQRSPDLVQYKNASGAGFGFWDCCVDLPHGQWPMGLRAAPDSPLSAARRALQGGADHKGGKHARLRGTKGRLGGMASKDSRNAVLLA
jgi:hypothetical protein